MNYSKIKVLQNQKNLSDRKFAKSIGLTGPGYKTMIEKHTCTVETLETICKIYGLELSYFFDESGVPFCNPVIIDENCPRCKVFEAIIEELRNDKKEQQNQIALLNRELGRRSTGERGKAG